MFNKLSKLVWRQIKLTVAKYYTPSGRCIQKLDYSSMQGSSKKIDDSLVKKFKTSNGRDVTDSRAVEPDIKVEPEYFSAITEKLILKDVIFDFVNKNIAFYDSSILHPSTFMLPDSAYYSFITLAKAKNLNSETESSSRLRELKKVAKKEKYIEENKEIFVLLDTIFKSNINTDLIKNREEIQFFIESEMIAREHFQKGRMEASIKKDPYVQTANKILNNQLEYNEILGINQ